MTPEQERALEALREALRQASWNSEYIRVRQEDLRQIEKLLLSLLEDQ